MKKMISCLAVLAILAAAPTTTAFAADTAPAAVSEEAFYDETDIRNLVGQWKYQTAPEGMNITAGVTDSGIIDIKSDGTYIYTDTDGNKHSGTVKVDYDTFGGEYKVPFFAFYEGDEFFIGCYCSQNNPNVYIVGNGGSAQLLSAAADFSAIEGEWEEFNGDGRTFTIDGSGWYTVTYPDDTKDGGFICIGKKPYIDGGSGTWYNFYNQSGKPWISFMKTDEGTVNELTEGDFCLIRRNADTKNEYGFYAPCSYHVSSVSAADLIGTWKEEKNDKAVLTITEGRTMYDGRFEYANGSETVRGIIKIEYTLTQGGDKEYWYTFYNIDGSYWKAFGVSGDIPLNDLYSEQDGAVHFARQNETVDEKLADKNEIAAARMNDLNIIFAVMNASPQFTEDAGANDCVKVTDRRFASISDVKAFISATCTGELKDELFRDCDYCFSEKNGSLFVKNPHRSFYQFRTEKGVTITDPAMNYFTAIANEGDDLYGSGKATFFYDEGKWLIKSYAFGDVIEAAKHDISEIAGTWNETDTAAPRTLTINADGSFTVAENGGAEINGTVKVEDLGYPNGSVMTWFNLYKENGEFYTGFEATSQTPLNDLYTGQDSTEHFVRYTAPENKYSSEELRDMSIKDYEQKTSVRAASTEVYDNNHGVTTVVLKDDKNKVLDTYTLDPTTGKGTNSKNEDIELPQTGNNSLRTAGPASAAMALLLAGTCAVFRSGMLRRKED